MFDRNLTKTVKKVKELADCRELFQEEFPEHYRPHGNSYCPWHDDNKTFSLSLKEEAVFCFGACASNGKPKAYDPYNVTYGTSKTSSMHLFLCDR